MSIPGLAGLRAEVTVTCGGRPVRGGAARILEGRGYLGEQPGIGEAPE
jgi:hypothetical protein